jgi:hypothetical protein
MIVGYVRGEVKGPLRDGARAPLLLRSWAAWLAVVILLVAADPSPRFLGMHRAGKRPPPTRERRLKSLHDDYNLPPAVASAAESRPLEATPASVPSPVRRTGAHPEANGSPLGSIPALVRSSSLHGSGPPLRC